MLQSVASYCRLSLKLLMGSVLVIGVSGAAFAAQFLKVLEDIPLPGGMQETVNSVEFDSPYGRIVESMARGNVSIEDVNAFYIQSMPALGWMKSSQEGLVFQRGDETLYLDLSQVDEQVSVHYRLVVRPASSKMED